MAYPARTRQIVETSKYNPEAKASPAVAAEHGRVQKHLVCFGAACLLGSVFNVSSYSLRCKRGLVSLA